MNPFIYENPTRLRFGENVINTLSEEIHRFGSRILLLYGSDSAKKNGSYDDVSTQIVKSGCFVVEHPGVSGNPLRSHANAAIKLVKENNIEVIIALGGGSVIDEAKAIAAGALYDGDVWDFYTRKAVVTRALPVLAVLTLPATASEMNGFSVLTHDETHEKSAIGAAPVLNPKVSFCDPRYSTTVSLQQTAFAAADILSHLTEAYLTTSADELFPQDELIEGAVRSVLATMKKIIVNPADVEARSSLMWTATLAWNGTLQVGIPNAALPCHALEMPLSGIYNVAHGAGLAILTPHWMRAMGHVHRKRILKLGTKIFGVSDSVESVAAALESAYKSFGAPLTMKDVGISAIDCNTLVNDAIVSFERRGLHGYSEPILRQIYESI